MDWKLVQFEKLSVFFDFCSGGAVEYFNFFFVFFKFIIVSVKSIVIFVKFMFSELK